MAELALDDHKWDAFVGHLDGMGVTELVWGDAASHARAFGDPAPLDTD